MLEAGAVAMATQGLDSGLGLNDVSLSQVGDDMVHGVAFATEVLEGAGEVVGRSLVSAAVNTVAYGGSFGNTFENGMFANLAAVGAGAIGGLDQEGVFGTGLPRVLLDTAAHGALGCVASAAEGTGCAGGAIGGAASAALSPDLLKAIDPTGAALTSGQQAVMEGFATLLGGGLAGLAGANAQGGATAAQNEVLNNTDKHPEDAAKSGGVLSAFENLVSAVGDQLASAGRGAVNMGNQFIGLMNANSGQTPPSDPNPLVSASNGGNPPATGGAVVTPPAYAMTPEGPVPIAPGVVVPGLSPGNAILSSNGNDSGTGAGASGAGSASGGSGLSAADQLAANKAAGAAFEQAVETQLSQSGYTIGQQVTIETESGVRTRLDFLTLDPLTGDVSCVECKASSTAPLTTNQKLAFPEIAQSGGTVVGAGKPGFPGGTSIPPTTVQIIRGP